ncbi:retrovirus-related pol polyprotein from transposon TNT 1-94 [Tanacetum coccineum]
MSEQMINHVNNWEKANKEHNNESVTAELERYKERVKTFEQRLNIDLSSREKMIDSQMDDMIKEKIALKEQVDSLEQNLSKQIKEMESLLQRFMVFKNESKEKENKYMENEINLEKKIKELDNIIFKVGQSAQTVHMLTKPQVFYDNIHKQALGYQNPFYLKKAQRIKPTLYDGIVISAKHVAMPVIDDEETLILEEESRSKMFEKEKDPEAIKQNISHKPIDYEKLNRLSKDFGKLEVPSELPKVSLVNASLKKLKFYPAQFDSVVKKRTTPVARTKDIFNVFDKDLLNEIMEVQTVFDQMDSAVQQSSVDKQCLEIAKKELLLENDRLLQQIMSQDVLLTVMNSMSLIGESVNMERKRNESCDKCFNLDAELLKSQNAHNDLLKSYSQLEKHFEQAKAKQPLDNVLDFACKDAQVESSTTSDSNTPVLSPTGLKCSTSNCGSKPTSNKKNDRISRTPSSSKKAKTVESKNANHSEPIHTWGSNATDFPSSSSLVMTGCPDCSLVSGLRMFKTYDMESFSAHELLYYVEGLGHNLFSVGQFCDTDLEVTFWKNTCFIRNLEGVDLLLGSRDTNLYTISLDDMLKTSSICLLSKASKTKSWLWHRRLSHLNFGTLNKLAKDVLARVIVDDYSRFTWVRFLRTKDEAPEAIIKCIKNIQVCLNATVRNVRTDNGTEFAEAINTTRYTQNRSLIRLRYNKTPCELMQDKKLDLSFFHIFGALCYTTNDNDDLDKLDAKADIGIFVGYALAKKAFRIYNKRTRKIIETIHVTFDELTALASE